MPAPPPPSRAGPALRLARRAWRLQYRDSAQSLALAERALAMGDRLGDASAVAWARLAQAYHHMRYGPMPVALREFRAARRGFARLGDERGQMLADVGVARCTWRQGRLHEALDIVLPLRDRGMALLRHEERGMLLNSIAGCCSVMGRPDEAFGYMYQALREAGPARGHGFDTVLYCNLAHELCLLGDQDEALAYVEEGLRRCATMNTPLFHAALLINRVQSLTDVGRAADALPVIHELLAMRDDAVGLGVQDMSFESLAIAALRAGDVALGSDLLQRARAAVDVDGLPDTHIELAVAEAEAARCAGRLDDALGHLARLDPLTREGISLRARCMAWQLRADLCQLQGDPSGAVHALREWQLAHLARSAMASRARQQAASLQTELMRAQRRHEEIDARRQASERAREALSAINRQLSARVAEVQALQLELQQQALRDPLTGLYNRRHMNEVLGPMFLLAQRDRLPLSVVIVDLDHFKAVNDRHGHLAGDRVLSAFGALLAVHLRRSDVACRYGGEEFCLLMPRTAAAMARRKLAAMLKAWRAQTFDLDAGRLTQLSFSAGVADTAAGEWIAPEQLLRAADDAALQAKRSGRGRVVLATP